MNKWNVALNAFLWRQILQKCISNFENKPKFENAKSFKFPFLFRIWLKSQKVLSESKEAYRDEKGA